MQQHVDCALPSPTTKILRLDDWLYVFAMTLSSENTTQQSKCARSGKGLAC